MVKIFKIHKYAGLMAGVLLFILAFTGFFLDHKNWSFIYTIGIENVPISVYKHEKRLIEAYWVDPKDSGHIIVGSRRGVFHKKDTDFVKRLSQQCLALRSDGVSLYAATDDGVYILEVNTWKPFVLGGLFINAISIYEGKLLASVDKKELVLIDLLTSKVISKTEVQISASELKNDIKLSRFVRDLHYGRGLFDGDVSLLINDYDAFFIMAIVLSGYMVYYLIRAKKYAKISRQLIKIHANVFTILAIIPFVLIVITGVFLDHSKLLAGFMRSTTISNTFCAPVYKSLKEDIWSVNLGDNVYRIGNRYGVYESSDLKSWKMVSKGFAYKIKRIDENVYVSGMGAPNRILSEEQWKMFPKTPHMFKDINIQNSQQVFLSHKSKMSLPKSDNASLYSILFSLHDGSFFASWWIWINDIAAVLLMVLATTGTLRYLKKKKLIFRDKS